MGVNIQGKCPTFLKSMDTGHWTLDSRASAWFCLDAPLAQEAAVVHLVCWSFCFSAKPSRAEIWQDRRVSVSSR